MNEPKLSCDPSLLNLVMLLGSSALQQLGQPLGTHQEAIPVDLRAASMSIDMLAALEAKCKGNLTADEEKLLRDTLYSLRTLYVGISEKQKQAAPKPDAAAPAK